MNTVSVLTAISERLLISIFYRSTVNYYIHIIVSLSLSPSLGLVLLLPQVECPPPTGC